MSEIWHYTRGGQQNGPVSLEALHELLRNGNLLPQDLVWRQGMANWLPVAAVPELSPAAPPGFAVAGQPIQVDYYHPAQYVAYAGFWLRFLALIIDHVLIFLVLGAIAIGVDSLLGRSMSDTEESAFSFVFWICYWLYFALMESSVHQATLGKKVLGLTVTDLEGRPASFGKVSGRHFGKIVSGLLLYIGYIIAAFTQRKQALHDLMAGTLVIRRPSA